MEKILLIVLVIGLLIMGVIFLLWFAKNFRTVILKTIADIALYKGGAAQITLTDEYEGDIFFPYTGPLKADGGVVVQDAKGRLWQRKWNKAIGVDPCWWGARPDGVKDCIDALEAMVKFCTIEFGVANPMQNYWPPIMNFTNSGLYRISRQWKIGAAPCSPADAMRLDWFNTSNPSYNYDEHIKMASILPVSIKCNPRAYIMGDFKKDKKELTAIVSIGAGGWAYGGWDMQNVEIDGLKICGSDGMDMNAHGRDSGQVGLIMYGGNDTTVKNCGVYNCQVGLIQNASYFDRLTSNQFRNCGLGYISQGCHATSGFTLRAGHCDTGFEIRSGASTFKGMNTENCYTSLIVGNGFNHFDGLYFENNAENDNYHVVIGYDDGVDPRGDSPVMCTSINALTIAGANGILLRHGARQVDISGSNFVSSKVTMTHAENKIISRNNYGTDQMKPDPGQIYIAY